MKDKNKITRRAFIAVSTLMGTSIAFAKDKPNTAKVVPRKISPNEKLNLAGIGVGGKGREDILSCSRENVVALCDVDLDYASYTIKRLPNAKVYQDFRKMFDEMGKDIDAVTISTPDHSHALIAYTAMKLGKHVYVQKPLTHTIAEAKLLLQTAREMKVATQMGNQGHSGVGAREVCEMIWTGAIGEVKEVHIWTDRPRGRWPQGVGEPLPEQPVPPSMDWNLWIGPAPMRPYNKGYAPHKWRGWIDFGCGALGDMGCHIMDPAFWALKLDKATEVVVDIVKQEGRNNQTYPAWSIVKYEFPAREDMGPVTIYWYDNGNKPERPTDIPAEETLGDGENGSLFIGTKGYLTAGEYGGKPRLLPEARMNDYKKPDPILPRVSGSNHYRNWLEACKGGEPACSNFEYSVPLTEVVLLGCIAQRLERKLKYNFKEGKFIGDDEANQLLTKPYRPGFELPV